MNVSEQGTNMHSDDEGNLKKNCDEIFSNTTDAKEHNCVVKSSALSENLGYGTVADLVSSQHLKENDKSSKKRKPKECSQC